MIQSASSEQDIVGTRFDRFANRSPGPLTRTALTFLSSKTPSRRSPQHATHLDFSGYPSRRHSGLLWGLLEVEKDYLRHKWSEMQKVPNGGGANEVYLSPHAVLPCGEWLQTLRLRYTEKHRIKSSPQSRQSWKEINTNLMDSSNPSFNCLKLTRKRWLVDLLTLTDELKYPY